jgi:hypothetical protein
MKICIISSIGRSGTTSLFDMMSLCLPRYYTCLNEPFGPFQKGHEMNYVGITEVPKKVLNDYFYSPKKKVRIVKTII